MLTRKWRIFFRSLLSRWTDNLQDDGSYFIDIDPDIFHHILRYLRLGTFPVFFDKIKGHDYGLYSDVLAQARYFGIEPLGIWVEEKRYYAAVNIMYAAFLSYALAA